MATVYKRNRKKSQYQKYMLIDSALSTLYELKGNPNHKYFKIGDEEYAKNMEKNLILARESLYDTYLLKKLNTQYDELTQFSLSLQCIINTRKHLQDVISLLQRYYRLREFHKPGKSKKKSKIARRFFEFGSYLKLVIDDVDGMKSSYRKKLRKTIREYIKDEKYTETEIKKLLANEGIPIEEYHNIIESKFEKLEIIKDE